jgi:hypothetical protein
VQFHHIYQGSLTSGVVDLVLSSFKSALFYVEKIIYHFYKTSYLNEEVNCTERSPSLSVP